MEVQVVYADEYEMCSCTKKAIIAVVSISDVCERSPYCRGCLTKQLRTDGWVHDAVITWLTIELLGARRTLDEKVVEWKTVEEMM